jgi:uncharacterized radical SAM superfamily Fe-S cluster-containing enzyme
MNTEDIESAIWKELTEGLCPDCLRQVPTTLYEHSGRIWIQQECGKHGVHKALIASNAAEYHRFRKYVPDRGGCCGPGEVCGPNGQPPTCALLIEITQACNLRCPTCYADAQGHDFMTMVEIRRRLDAFFATQSKLDLLMISGGEPTIHPQFEEVLDVALTYPIDRVLVNTNGIRLHQSDQIRDILAARRSRVELYFSFSSFRPEVHVHLYGKDLRKEKLNAIDRAQKANIFVTLVPTLERGVNDDEIGDLYRYALSMDNINGINFQPVMQNGRYLNQFEPAERLTMTDVLALLEEQTNGDLKSSDFVALPCSHPDCCTLTYGILDKTRATLIPLPRHLDIAKYMQLFSDRISFSGMLGSAARRVWSDMAQFRGGQTLRDLYVLFRKAGLAEVAPLIGDQEAFGKRVFRIVVKPFMDAHTYDLKRIDQCCTKIVDERGVAVSFCEYNVFHRTKPGPRKDTLVSLKMAPPVVTSANEVQ